MKKIVQYDPNKAYKWEPDQTFTITGKEFALLLNTLRSVISTPEAQNVLIADKAHSVLEKLLISGVEDGSIEEKVE